MRVLVKTADMPREEWLKWRTKGIGGSDASIIAGVNKFKSIFQLWLEKTGQIVPEESESEYTHFGNVLEPVVKKEFTRRTGLKVRAKKMLLARKIQCYCRTFPVIPYGIHLLLGW